VIGRTKLFELKLDILLISAPMSLGILISLQVIKLSRVYKNTNHGITFSTVILASMTSALDVMRP
jgi:hypothetical protein